MADNSKLILIGVVLVLGILSYILMNSNQPSIPAGKTWQEAYKDSAVTAGVDLDLSQPEGVFSADAQIQDIANSIALKSRSAKDAVKNTLDYVYQAVSYVPSPPGCYQETASTVLQNRVGNCVSMTKLTVALLRAQNIIARPVGGCISSSFSCNVIYSAHPERAPKIVPVVGTEGLKGGGLHEWVEIWLPETGWVYGEATSGQLFPKSCSSYDIHDYNTDPYGICVISDGGYIRQCARY